MLLMLDWIGGSFKALIAVYGNRQRHNWRKLRFLILLWLAVFTRLAGLAIVHWLLLQPHGA